MLGYIHILIITDLQNKSGKAHETSDSGNLDGDGSSSVVRRRSRVCAGAGGGDRLAHASGGGGVGSDGRAGGLSDGDGNLSAGILSGRGDGVRAGGSCFCVSVMLYERSLF